VRGFSLLLQLDEPYQNSNSIDILRLSNAQAMSLSQNLSEGFEFTNACDENDNPFVVSTPTEGSSIAISDGNRS
jgi:hypothetical protein